MENEEIYPKGTKQETDDFALRQKIKKIVGDETEAIVKEETFKAFKKLGYEEKEGYMFMAASGEDGKEKEIGKGVQEGKLNVTISKPKMLNMGAIRPVSYMQKVTSFGGKRIISELYLEIIDNTVNISYKNTEASGFHQSSNKDTYAPRKLDKNATIPGVTDTKSFKSKLKDFFAEIAEAEAEYLTGTKIGNSDKNPKDMNDSIIKENKYSMKLTDLFSSSFEDAGNKIDNLVKESLNASEEKKEKCGVGTPATSSGKPTDKKLVIGDEEKKIEEDSLEEIATSGGGAGAGTAGKFAYDSPEAFEKNKREEGCKEEGCEMNESIKNTTYGQMRTTRAHLTRQDNGSYTLITETQKPKTPYSDVVPMGENGLWPPKYMDKNHTVGAPGVSGAEVNSKEELAQTGHGELSELEKTNEAYQKKLELSKRKFSSLLENEEKGINKRYIITEKFTKEEQSRRWKQLFENNSFSEVKDQKDTVSGHDYDKIANKEFAANNPPMESNLCNTPFSGEEKGFIDIPKVTGSMILFRLSESDVRQNKTYIIDHFTNKLVLNPLFKSKE